LSLFTGNLFSQDSVKVIRPKDSTKAIIKPVQDTTTNINRFILSNHVFLYINRSEPDTITRARFLWLPLKSIEDIFNYLPGYNLKFTDVGQIGQLNYNQMDQNYTGVFRNGRPINDLLDGMIDFNLLSRNEVSDIELTNGFGNFLYNYTNGVNIVNKQIFQYKPYSEITYWQDRYENLYFDGNYHQNLFKNFNFNFGITKHSYDGRYTNSDFDTWQGRFNFNFAASSKVNMFLYANYSHIQRGLNEGIDPLKTNVSNNDSLSNSTLAIVRNPNSNETRERFDVDFGILHSVKSSFTKLQFFESNSFRKYFDPNSVFLVEKTHWIDYGIKLQQIFNYDINKNLNVVSRTEGEFNQDFINSPLSNLRHSVRYLFLEDLSLKFKGFTANGYGKAIRYDYYDSKFYFDYGAKANYKIKFDSTNHVDVYGQFSQVNKLPSYLQKFLDEYYVSGSNIINEKVKTSSIGVTFVYKNLNLDVKYSSISRDGFITNVNYPTAYIIKPSSILKDNTISSRLGFKLTHFEIEANAEYNINNHDDPYFPQLAGNAIVSYHNLYFRNKLEVKIGVNTRFWGDYWSPGYDSRYNQFKDRLEVYDYIFYPVPVVRRNATLDFFVIGKINKAIFGLTLENILNRVEYTTAYYPYQDRGGLANIISRFNITWYFLN